jgi:type IV pilus assembly protein PilV
MKYQTQRGATLIEVAVTVLILSSSLLAMATLQTRSLQFNQSAYMRSQANIYAYDIMDRIRINRGNNSANIGNYNLAYGSAPGGAGLIGRDLTTWRANIARSLPEGDGSILCNGRLCEIRIKWSEKQVFGAREQDDDETLSELVYRSNI